MSNHLLKKLLVVFCAGVLRYNRHTVILFLCFLWIASLPNVFAQSSSQSNNKHKTEELTIGSKIPDELWTLPLQVINHPQGKETITLAEYKDKLIILDFWATWCGTCIAALPRLHQLEKELENDVVILPITDQDGEKVAAFLNKNRLLSPLNLMTVVQDSVFKAQFPYTMLPHEVWINKAGELYAITHSSDVTKENIATAIIGTRSNVTQKKDNLTYDPKMPLLINNNGAEESYFLGRSIITPIIPGIPSLNSLPTGNNIDTSTIRVSATNATIRRMYSLAFKELRTMPINRTIMEFKVPLSVLEKKFLKDMYCYDMIAPVTGLKNLSYKIQNDLNYFFGINARIEKRKQNCYVIKKIGKPNIILGLPENGHQFLSAWVNTINKNIEQRPLINDFFEEKISIPQLPPVIDDANALNIILKPYGIAIKEEKRILDFFVISEL